jgi:hypothetical protein
MATGWITKTFLSHFKLCDSRCVTNPPLVTRWPEHGQQPGASWWYRQQRSPSLTPDWLQYSHIQLLVAPKHRRKTNVHPRFLLSAFKAVLFCLETLRTPITPLLFPSRFFPIHHYSSIAALPDAIAWILKAPLHCLSPLSLICASLNNKEYRPTSAFLCCCELNLLCTEILGFRTLSIVRIFPK